MNGFESQEWEGFEFQETPEVGEWEAGEFSNQEDYLGGGFGSTYSGEASQQEVELAQELLEVTSERELEEFLGNVFKGAARAVGGFIRSPVGKALGGALKDVARTALPVAAGALGNYLVPGVGGVIGSKLGSMASRLFEVEMESMSESEAELEVARRYVRFASAAARNAARAPAGAPPRAVARAALISAARRHAPGLVRGARPDARGPGQRPRFRPRRGYGYRGGSDIRDVVINADGGPQSDWADDDAPSANGYGANGYTEGRWIRRGRRILLLRV